MHGQMDGSVRLHDFSSGRTTISRVSGNKLDFNSSYTRYKPLFLFVLLQAGAVARGGHQGAGADCC